MNRHPLRKAAAENPTLRDLLPSIVRTFVPVLVGWFVGWATRKGLDVSTEQVGILFEVLVMGTYYTVIRVAEQRWPAVGVLLGWRARPEYPVKEPLPSFEDG